MTPLLHRACLLLGFRDIPFDLSDKPVVNLHYLYRVHEQQHQYLSLCFAPHDAHLFCEAVFEAFYAPRNSKAKRVGKVSDQQKKGASPLYVNLARDWATIEAMVNHVYPLAKA